MRSMTDFEIRDTELSDVLPLARIIDDEWGFRLYSEQNGVKMAEHYLLHCMDGSNKCVTLVADGRPSGILIMRDMGGRILDFSKECESKLSEFASDPNCSLYLKESDDLYGAYQEFAREHKSPNWSEMRLVIISEDIRGNGIGRRLMDEARRISESFGKNGIFFFSDTDCNLDFYDHIGAERLCQTHLIIMGEDLDIYGYRIVFDRSGIPAL